MELLGDILLVLFPVTSSFSFLSFLPSISLVFFFFGGGGSGTHSAVQGWPSTQMLGIKACTSWLLSFFLKQSSPICHTVAQVVLELVAILWPQLSESQYDNLESTWLDKAGQSLI